MSYKQKQVCDHCGKEVDEVVEFVTSEEEFYQFCMDDFIITFGEGKHVDEKVN